MARMLWFLLASVFVALAGRGAGDASPEQALPVACDLLSAATVEARLATPEWDAQPGGQSVGGDETSIEILPGTCFWTTLDNRQLSLLISDGAATRADEMQRWGEQPTPNQLPFDYGDGGVQFCFELPPTVTCTFAAYVGDLRVQVGLNSDIALTPDEAAAILDESLAAA